MNKPSIFAYLDYRVFLADYYAQKKAQEKGFSYRSFLQKAGISSPSFYKQIVDGERNFSSESLQKFISAIPFDPKEKQYFEILVEYNQAKKSIQKDKYLEELKSIAGHIPYAILSEDKLGLYQKWYYPALREILCLPQIKHSEIDWQKIASLFNPRIKAKEAQNGTEYLLEQNFISVQEDRFILTDKTVHTGDSLQSTLIRQFNQFMLELGKNALDQLPLSERHCSGITMGVSEATYQEICQDIREFQNQMMRKIQNDNAEIDRILQMNILLFPLSAPQSHSKL
jgi:uncharacterized protein (TIGR02147 family)